jgi:hypothetical protein
MSSEIRLRRSPRLNVEYVSSSDESDSAKYESDSMGDNSPYSDYFEFFDNKIDFFTRLSKAFIFVPFLYSFLNGFYFHSVVSCSMLISNYYPNLSICKNNIGDVSYQIGFYTYAASQIYITTPENIYFILFSGTGIQYCYLFYTILYIRRDNRFAHFKVFMNFFICFTKCMILYYLNAVAQSRVE